MGVEDLAVEQRTRACPTCGSLTRTGRPCDCCGRPVPVREIQCVCGARVRIDRTCACGRRGQEAEDQNDRDFD
jgi:hypothetical protein